MQYEELIINAESEGIEVIENSCISKLKGLCVDNIITINSNIKTSSEKICVLAEELGHYRTTYGNILDQSKVENRKQERRARAWAYERLVNLASLIEASRQSIRNKYELAEFLGVSEKFIEEAISYYKDKHGIYYEIDNYIIYFEPLGVLEKYKVENDD